MTSTGSRTSTRFEASNVEVMAEKDDESSSLVKGTSGLILRGWDISTFQLPCASRAMTLGWWGCTSLRPAVAMFTVCVRSYLRGHKDFLLPHGVMNRECISTSLKDSDRGICFKTIVKSIWYTPLFVICR